MNRIESDKGRYQHADPHQLCQEDSDAVWNELAFFKKEHKRLLIEKWVCFLNDVYIKKRSAVFSEVSALQVTEEKFLAKFQYKTIFYQKQKRKTSALFFFPFFSLPLLNQWQVTSLLALTETVFHDLGIVLINMALICWRCRSSLACVLHTAVLHFWNEVVRG